MAHPALGKFRILGRYEVHFGRGEKGSFFYEMEDLETFVVVDVKDGLTEEEFLQAIGCALDPLELLEVQKQVHSLI